MMKRRLRNFSKTVYKAAFPPLYVRRCSQTIYQCLIYLLELNRRPGNDPCADLALLVEYAKNQQRPDGGFDIGYAFDFGFIHRKGESTAPEALMLVPLIVCHQLGIDPELKTVIAAGVDWISRNAVCIDTERAYLPYGPMSSRNVAVYNGTSFAQAPLAMWGVIQKEKNLINLAERMNRYLLSKAVESEFGLVIPYSEPRANLTPAEIEKVDYYHLAQQAEMHFVSAKKISSKAAEALAVGFAETLRAVAETRPVIPYLNNGLFGNQIHVWGLASTVAAFADAYDYTQDDRYLEAADKQYDWLMRYAYRGDYFAPVLTEAGEVVDDRYYPRSDAWVIASLQKYLRSRPGTEADTASTRLASVYRRCRAVDFSGPENHASTRARIALVSLAKLLLGKAQ